MKILITGGTGFLGKSVCNKALTHHEVFVLTRNKYKASKALPKSVHILTREDDFPKVDVIFNFAGAAISAKFLNVKRMQVLLQSRVQILEFLTKKYQRNSLPKFFIQASATGIYSNNQACDEKGECCGYFSELIKSIERVAFQSFAACTHFSILRFGVILGQNGGLFRILNKLPQLRIVPDEGNIVPWVSIDDATKACLFILTHPLDGIVNVSNPYPLTANELLYAGRNKRLYLPIPIFLLKNTFDKRGQLLTVSHYILSRRLIDQGFVFSLLPDSNF